MSAHSVTVRNIAKSARRRGGSRHLGAAVRSSHPARATAADPLETLGIIPVEPLPCWGWGDIPDQYGRRWDGDDGSSTMPKPPGGLADLPPILPGWGPRRVRPAASPADGSAIRYRDLIT